ncbi:MAG: NAD(P)/FAD-dependent oxidoreductase, partial [Candidatus Helarchaeota archaeon]|nr:NAD(P)/FAD-dependent oxidoreductase [Candidatus Helarchaeota archaeon]
MVDIACIGGGPASAFAALEILKKGQNVEIFEEHKEIGVPTHCAGLISVSGFNKLGIRVPEECIQHKVKGSIFYSPLGHTLTVKRKKDQAYVIDRAKFDRFLVDNVERQGGKVHLNAKVTSLIKANNKIEGLMVEDREGPKRIKTKIVLDGEGFKANFLKEAGLKPVDRERMIPAVQFDMKDVRVDENYVEIYVGRKIAPGFFAYIIPTSNNTARVAVGSNSDKPMNYMHYFIKKHPIASSKLKQGTIVKHGGGWIIIGGPVKKTYTPGFMGVGDAVGQVKATTGGGVVFGGLCAQIAGKIAAEAITQNDFSERMLKGYQIEWQKLYLRELKLMKLLRQILNALPDRSLDELFRSISKPGIEIPKLIEEMGDMDMQGNLIKKILFSPKIL